MARIAGIEQALADAGGVVPEARQGELLAPADGARAPVEGARKPGRPLGARGRRTEEFRRELAARGGKMPGLWLYDLYNEDTAKLSERLGIKRADALAEQRMAAIALLPYTEQQLPRDLNVEGKGALLFAMLDPAKLTGEAGADQAGPVRLVIEGDQGVSTAEDPGVGQDGVGQDAPSD